MTCPSCTGMPPRRLSGCHRPSWNAHSRASCAVVIVFLGIVSSILVLDWRHILTLHGHINWATLSWPGRIGIVLVYAFFMVLLLSLPLLYLVFALKDTIDQWRNRAHVIKLKTAELEASLGIVPGTKGECPQCRKPLQVGAEYCAYCGVSVSRKPVFMQTALRRRCRTHSSAQPAEPRLTDPTPHLNGRKVAFHLRTQLCSARPGSIEYRGASRPHV